ncbi:MULTISPECIES: STAS domain-containing protein [unclassified Bacillus (in: firmicutes)]|uniref:STAS domain-containing protein n=1 Tax=unclassified Bacillus (in: firmicutes) TaxID=185979 RepID=UPI0008E8EC04|nr:MULTISPECIES: STAS domain-containing protein [unclassified Bacillus (in: firmicutes)]SFA87013.1 Anti-anti-sigma regulatory factor (antagonist of anti-sigma factor) [Bacillus sp. UNCCL13]SFQ84014.1 Anti-anti-sigma regulatory factor (antagonist of anti-sigma factor) [Bacillus sp. cl95]
METEYYKAADVTAFITENKEQFEKKLLSEAVNVASKIQEILLKGNIDLLKNAGKLSQYVINQKEEELVAFAEIEGIAWAHHSLSLSFKLEWVQAIRRTLWHFLYQFDKLNNANTKREEFFALEKKINDRIDQFLNTFFISFSSYKDELLNTQRQMVEHLSVPIIPISPSVAVLPLIGIMDSYRMRIIEEKVLMDIAKLKVQTLIFDLSGIAEMEMNDIDHFQKVLRGVAMMGAKPIITGLRPELVRTMIHTGIAFEKAAVKGTLQESLKNLLS